MATNVVEKIMTGGQDEGDATGKIHEGVAR